MLTGIEKLKAAVERDESRDKFHDYRKKLDWIIERAKHYAEVSGMDYEKIIDRWEYRRNYSYINYYQDSNQPRLDGKRVLIFENQEHLQKELSCKNFRCPYCEGVSKNPYECDSGKEVKLINSGNEVKKCNWKVYGFLGGLGKEVFIFLKDMAAGEKIFPPVDFDDQHHEAEEASEDGRQI